MPACQRDSKGNGGTEMPLGVKRGKNAELRKNMSVSIEGKQLKLPAYQIMLMSTSDRALLDCVKSLDPLINCAARLCVDGHFQNRAWHAEIRRTAKVILKEEWYRLARPPRA
jgi:hypothetical protein